MLVISQICRVSCSVRVFSPPSPPPILALSLFSLAFFFLSVRPSHPWEIPEKKKEIFSRIKVYAPLQLKPED